MKKIVVTIIVVLAIIGVFVYAKNSKNDEDNTVILENESEEFGEISEDILEETINNNETNSFEDYATNLTEGTIEQVAQPTGFMGSSLYRVVLISTGDVYVQKFDGEDEDKENIVLEQLIASGATSIRSVEDEGDSNYGKVIVSGGTIVDSEYGWIEFE